MTTIVAGVPAITLGVPAITLGVPAIAAGVLPSRSLRKKYGGKHANLLRKPLSIVKNIRAGQGTHLMQPILHLLRLIPVGILRRN